MRKVFAVLIVGLGIFLSVIWIMSDPGLMEIFSDSAIIIGFIPIPGALLGFLLQLVPTIIALVFACTLWNKKR